MSMAPRRLVFLLAHALACVALPVLAQPSGPSIEVPGANVPRAGPRPLGPVPAAAAATPRPSNQPVPLDRVIAVVNDEALTQYELDEQKRIVLQQMRANNVRPPPPDVFDTQLLERMIIDRALLQFAKENGVRVDDADGRAHHPAHRAGEQDHAGRASAARSTARRSRTRKYREDIRREITIQRVREREVDSKRAGVRSRGRQLPRDGRRAGGRRERIRARAHHGRRARPGDARPDRAAARRAEEALSAIKSGKDFKEVAAQYSDAQDAISGGDLGWRTPARLPVVFASALKDMQKGDVSPVLRSPGGFHIVKLNDKRGRNAPTVVEQTHVRHILVRGERDHVGDRRQGEDRPHARPHRRPAPSSRTRRALNSEDASSSKGGDLGWVTPGRHRARVRAGDEQAQDRRGVAAGALAVRLAPRSWSTSGARRTCRRRASATAPAQAIRARKADEQFSEFMRQVRDKAYVEYKTDEK